MRRWLNAWVLAAPIAAGFSLVATAHEDDPKILDRLPPYTGPGYRAALRGQPPPFPASNVTLQSWVTIPEFNPGFTSANDCWGYVSASGREYAIIGLSDGTGFVDITIPANATIVTVMPGPNSLWRDIKVYQDHAYAVSEGGSGIQVFDLTQIDSGIVTLVNTINDVGTGATHNVALDTTSGFLYRCGGASNGLRIYSLADPANPTFVGQWTDRYVHDAEIVTFTSGPNAGRQIAFCSSGFNGGFDETGVDILDVTNKSSIVNLSRAFYAGAAYSHQLWLSPDGTHLYVNDELDESDFGTLTNSRVVDVSDLTNPVELATFSSGSTSIDHNLYIKGALIFEANYRSGLRVFDATDPLNPVQVAFFDTFPADDNPNFNSLWSNYPYFPSGTIIGSDIERGLFVWTLDVPLSIFLPDGRPATISTAGATFAVEITETTPGSLNPGSPMLHYDAGAGTISVPLTLVSGTTYQAALPALPCNSSVSFYLTAESNTAVTAASPVNAATEVYTARVVGIDALVSAETFESPSAWVVDFDGTDDATTGLWTQGNPNGTLAQPENDHTPGGTDCWFTGQANPGDGIGTNDVDGGTTTLTSAPMDLTGLTEPIISYWQWYSNNQGGAPGQDVFAAEISNDDGASWTPVTTVGPAGPGTAGGWMEIEMRVADFVTPTAQIRVRFSASDLGAGSIVEAAIDDVRVRDQRCSSCIEDVDGDGAVTLSDLATVLGNFGVSGASHSQGDVNGDGIVNLSDLAAVLAVFGSTC